VAGRKANSRVGEVENRKKQPKEEINRGRFRRLGDAFRRDVDKTWGCLEPGRGRKSRLRGSIEEYERGKGGEGVVRDCVATQEVNEERARRLDLQNCT